MVFDWGGTLTPFHAVDLADLWLEAARVLAPERAEELAAALVTVENEFWQRVRRDAGHNTSARLPELVALASSRTGIDIGEALHDAGMLRYLEAWTPHTYTDPEAAPLLTALRERGVRTGLLSNTNWPREWHERFLERDGVLELLDARVYTSDLAHTKPHPEAFHAVLGELGVAPSEAVMVGDRPYDDIWGAKSVGMLAVLLPNDVVPPGPVPPDATINGLAELLPLLDRWTE